MKIYIKISLLIFFVILVCFFSYIFIIDLEGSFAVIELFGSEGNEHLTPIIFYIGNTTCAFCSMVACMYTFIKILKTKSIQS